MFHSEIAFEADSPLELTFCLPSEDRRETCILSHANAKALRIWKLNDGATPVYAVAAAIDWIEFSRPPVDHLVELLAAQ